MTIDTASPLAATDVPLSRLLREGSQSEHTEAETSDFMSFLLEGKVSRDGYAAYLLAMAPVYDALEAAGRALVGDAARPDPLAAAVWDPLLERAAALAEDLTFFAGPDWRARVSTDPAVTAYVERLEHSRSWGGLFIAHHYTRYLGDLSGGQAIGRIIARTYDLADGEGTAFYRFAGIEKPKPYKDGYRARLDSLDLGPAQRADALAEVKLAFRLNHGIFTALSADLDRYLVTD
ncbi:biliverdin-producing heme oxygenase [Nocardioides massiliensis]|uniref:Heme oxygenase n=1 Tax=Nocardioides massiliensis TaxID=1325935 RepID=A0ABT9NRM2_9ACTN|nr:biliverdin-producing heme oxygenase [Nocardioides massiliensis]MDP9823072.1 heme oxygenase [Nocardioides massiliensis]